MFARLGRLVTRRPLWILFSWIVLASVAAAYAMTGLGLGQGLFDRLETGEPGVPGSQSEQVSAILDASAGGVTTTLLVTGVDLADAAVVDAVGEQLAAADLAAITDVAEVLSPFAHPAGPLAPEVAALVGTDQDAFVVRVTLASDLARDAEDTAYDAVAADLGTLAEDLVADGLADRADVSSWRVLVGAVNHQMEQDLVRGELVALPVALLVMIVVFGGALAAGMPILGALASIGTGLGTVLGLSHLMELDSVVINVVTVLGLGLSIDYGLLVVSRFREELAERVAQHDEAITAGIAVGRRRRGGRRRDPLVVDAAVRTISTAGRTVVFSALTIAISVSGLVLMSSGLLQGIGVAAAFVVLGALLTAVTLVPAVLVLTGRRLLRPSVLSRVPVLRRVVGRLGDVSPEHGVFSRIAGVVQRRAWLVMVGCLGLLLLLASPVLHLNLSNSGVTLLPPGTAERDTLDLIDEQFPALASADLYLVPTGGALVDVTDLAVAAAAVPGVRDVSTPTVLADPEGHTLLTVQLDVDPGSTEAVDVVRDLRALDPELLVGGQAAGQLDFTTALIDGLPLAGGLVVLATFVLLFLMTGSVMVPLKALVTNVLSITASLGITTWVFQDGHGSGLLGFESVGGVESYIVAVVVAFGFGLAMDYEVFLLARVKELYDGGLSNDDAVRLGLQRSGRIITSAALVIIVVFAGFASGDLLPIKEVGFALAVAVALDATIVRMLLVPATMTVLGEANWWAPRWLRPLARRLAVQH